MSDEELKNPNEEAVEPGEVRASLFGYVRQLSDTAPNFVSSMFGSTFYETVREVAEMIDETLSELVESPLATVDAANRERAMDNPIYRDIENRRNPEGESYSIFLDENQNLGFNELEIQYNIYDEVKEEPWWVEPARLLQRSPVQGAVNSIWARYQRAVRGWSDSDAWSLDIHLARTLGEQLNYLADIAHGWPRSEEYPTMEDWVTALRENAALLLAYYNGKVGEWSSEDAELSFSERLKKEDDLADGAKRAYMWLGRNFQALWD